MFEEGPLIYAIVGIIICVQIFFFLRNLKKILAYKNIIASNKKLAIVEFSIDEEKATTLDPEYFIENKRFYENLENSKPSNYEETDDAVESFDKIDEDNKYDAHENVDDDD